MTYEEALAYIDHAESLGSVLGLATIRALMTRMGSPQDDLAFIHVAGTNGKGSVTAYLSAILKAAGYRVGRFTSPDLHAFTERISINGTDIPKDELARLTELVSGHVKQMKTAGEGSPTVFELSTAIAFQYFKEQDCNLVILEVGMGGRLDATNIIKAPLVSVLVPIAMDHMEILGDTLGKIAAEKAGIIKPGTVAVSAQQQPEAAEVISDACKIHNVSLHVVAQSALKLGQYDAFSQCFSYGDLENLEISLLGEHQIYNAALAVETIFALKEQGYSVPQEALRLGLKNTTWPARFEVLSRNPYVVVDGAHNPQGVSSLVAALERHFPGKPISFVIGVLRDKDYTTMMAQILPLAQRIFTVTPPSKRALPAAELADYLHGCAPQIPISAVGTGAGDAMEQCLERGKTQESVVCAFGSLYYVDAVRVWSAEQKSAAAALQKKNRAY